jgi:hypothetical protein
VVWRSGKAGELCGHGPPGRGPRPQWLEPRSGLPRGPQGLRSATAVRGPGTTVVRTRHKTSPARHIRAAARFSAAP